MKVKNITILYLKYKIKIVSWTLNSLSETMNSIIRLNLLVLWVGEKPNLFKINKVNQH
jgi:hypothetical protein